MLSRTADHLFWMARYVERAENTARMLDVNYSTSLLPQSAEAAERGWRAMLGISELQQAFDAKYQTLMARDVLDFDVEAFFRRIGLDQFISTQRRNGLAGLVQRIRRQASTIASGEEGVEVGRG